MIIQKIKDFLASQPDFYFTSEVTDTTSLVKSGVMDSFAMVRLVFYLEETFEIKVEAADLSLENFDNLQSIDRFLHSKLDVE